MQSGGREFDSPTVHQNYRDNPAGHPTTTKSDPLNSNIMVIFGIAGLLLISYAIWLKNEKRQDFLFILGGMALLIYSIFIKDLIFIVLQIVFIISSLVELIKLSKTK